MTREEFNSYISRHVYGNCGHCKRNCSDDDKTGAGGCSRFLISDDAWEEYSKPDVTKKALDLACEEHLDSEAFGYPSHNTSEWKEYFLERAKE